MLVSVFLLSFSIVISIKETELYLDDPTWDEYYTKVKAINRDFGIVSSTFLYILVVCLIFAFCLLKRAVKVNSEEKINKRLSESFSSVNPEIEDEEENDLDS